MTYKLAPQEHWDRTGSILYLLRLCLGGDRNSSFRYEGWVVK